MRRPVRTPTLVVAFCLLFAGAFLVRCTAINTAATKLAATPEGALFCTLATAGGGQLTVQVNQAVDAAAAAAAGPVGGAVAVIVTGMAQDAAFKDCAAAAVAANALSGTPQSPPPATVTPAIVTIPAAAKAT